MQIQKVCGIINKVKTTVQKLIGFYIILAWLAAIVAIIGFMLIVWRLDPTANLANIILFYTDVTVLTLSLGTLAGFYLRKFLGQREFAFSHLKISVRQSLWFAIVVVVSLILQRHNLFSYLNSILLVLSLVFLESYFLSRS